MKYSISCRRNMIVLWPEVMEDSIGGLLKYEEEIDHVLHPTRNMVLVAQLASQRIDATLVCKHEYWSTKYEKRGLSVYLSPSFPLCGQYLWYFRTLAEISALIVNCRSIKSGRLVRAPATELETRPRCQPPESGGMRPIGGKKPTFSLPPMRFVWRLSLIHGERACRIPIRTRQRTALHHFQFESYKKVNLTGWAIFSTRKHHL
jgi:hypothetical protein